MITEEIQAPVIEKRGANYVIKTSTIQTVYVEEEITLAQYIGRKIKVAREEKGWNYNQLGDRAGISNSNTIAIENGTTNPILSSLVSLADVLGYHITDLFPPKE
jgi:DNA-binding XRE family transcriptional regulator